MDKLVRLITKLKDNVNIHYDAGIPELDQSFFTDEDRNRISICEDNYKKNIELKYILKDKLNGSYSHHDINFWIINKWGGIRTKNTQENRNALEAFGDSLSGVDLSNLDRISSWSKVASFVDPVNNFIYDSKAVYSLNWLMLKSGYKKDYFPIPLGRNTKFRLYDLSTIIRLKTKDANPFLDEDKAYKEYCYFINNIYTEIYKEDLNLNEPFRIEMLLFASFDVLADEVSTCLSLTLNDNN